MRNYKKNETIKNYSQFCDWLETKDLDCEHETKNYTNDTIVIFRKDGKLLNDDTFEFKHVSPPKSYNVLKNKIEKVLKEK